MTQHKQLNYKTKLMCCYGSLNHPYTLLPELSFFINHLHPLSKSLKSLNFYCINRYHRLSGVSSIISVGWDVQWDDRLKTLARDNNLEGVLTMKKRQEKASQNRHKTGYLGVTYRVRNRRDGKGTERVYFVRYKNRLGRPVEVKVGSESDKPAMTAAQANRLRIGYAEGRKKNRIQARQVGKWTFSALMVDYLKYHKDLKKTTLTQRIRLRLWDTHLSDRIGHLTTSEFTQKKQNELYDEIKALKRYEASRTKALKKALANGDTKKARIFQDRLKAETRTLTESTVHNIFQVIKGLNEHAVKVRNLPTMPAKLTTKKGINKGIEHLTDEQIDTFLRIAKIWEDKYAANVMRLAFFSGMRHGAIIRLEWRDIDWVNGIIALRDGKSRVKGTVEYIPLNALAHELLSQILKETKFNGSHDPVIPNRDGKHISRQRSEDVRKLADAIGLPKNFRSVHGMRHSFATVQLQEGTKLEKLMKLLTHRQFTTTLIYEHLQIHDLRKDSDRMTKRVKRVKGQAVIKLKRVK